jgi:hypothetical protein
MRRFSSGSLSKTSGIIAVSTPRLADIGFICGIGRSVVALSPFLTQDATLNCEWTVSRDVRIRLAILDEGWSYSALNGLLDAAGVLSDRPVTSAGAPPSSSHLEMALLWFEHFGFCLSFG